MTDRLDSLKALREKVRAGRGFSDGEAHAAIPSVYPEPDLAMFAIRAFRGSLDAAKALHDAVLPGWHWGIEDDEEAEVFMSPIEQEDGNFRAGPSARSEWVGEPARAWLIAILSALIAIEEGKA